MDNEREMLLTALLHLQSLLRRISFDCQSNCPVKHAVDDARRPSLQAYTVAFGKGLDSVAQHVIFRHHLLDIEPDAQPIQPMNNRILFQMRFNERLIASRFQLASQFL